MRKIISWSTCMNPTQISTISFHPLQRVYNVAIVSHQTVLTGQRSNQDHISYWQAFVKAFRFTRENITWGRNEEGAITYHLHHVMASILSYFKMLLMAEKKTQLQTILQVNSETFLICVPRAQDAPIATNSPSWAKAM